MTDSIEAALESCQFGEDCGCCEKRNVLEKSYRQKSEELEREKKRHCLTEERVCIECISKMPAYTRALKDELEKIKSDHDDCLSMCDENVRLRERAENAEAEREALRKEFEAAKQMWRDAQNASFMK